VNDTYHERGSGGRIRATTGAFHVTTPTASTPAHAASPGHPSRWRGVLKWTALSLAIVVLIVAVGGYLLYRHLNGNITVQPINTLSSAPPKVVAKAENFLLIGSDSRAGANGKGTGGSAIAGARSDTTILMHISAGDGHATLISIPRDSWVKIPSCLEADGKSHTTPQYNKFNAAFSFGGAKYGPSCEIATVESLTHIHIDHYAVVDFDGFKRMVDALGGVRMCVAQPLDDPIHYDPATGGDVGSGLKLPAGKNVEIDGTQALALMRARYALGDGSDIERIKRQQQFIGAMIRKATSTSLLVDAPKLYRFLDATTKSITTDGFGIGTMKTLASALHRSGAGNVQILTVPLADPLPAGVPTADVAWDPVQSAALWQAIIHDQPIPGTKSTASPSASPSASPTTSPLTVAPSDITVTVLNGSGVTGVAAKAAAALTNEGFHATVGGDANSSSYATTVVKYGSGKAQSAQTVAAAITGAKRKADTSLSPTSITVIIGANYSGVTSVTVGTPTPTPTTSIAATTASKEGCLQ
jgi:LCP family protein required for cell wall assembly